MHISDTALGVGMPVCVSTPLHECICVHECRMCGNKGAMWAFGWAESKTRLRCRCSQLLGREEGGLLCGIYRHSCFPLIHKDLRGGVWGTQATRAHMTTAASHTFMRLRREVRAASRQLSAAVTFPHSRLHSSLLCWERWSMSGDGRRMKVSPLTKVSVIALIGRNVQYCKNLDCTYSELRHGDLTCLSSGVWREYNGTNFWGLQFSRNGLLASVYIWFPIFSFLSDVAICLHTSLRNISPPCDGTFDSAKRKRECWRWLLRGLARWGFLTNFCDLFASATKLSLQRSWKEVSWGQWLTERHFTPPYLQLWTSLTAAVEKCLNLNSLVVGTEHRNEQDLRLSQAVILHQLSDYSDISLNRSREFFWVPALIFPYFTPTLKVYLVPISFSCNLRFALIRRCSLYFSIVLAGKHRKH